MLCTIRGGYIAECYVPNNKIMELRELVRHRIVLVRMRTKLKNSIHGIMLMKGIQLSNTCTNTFTAGLVKQGPSLFEKFESRCIKFPYIWPCSKSRHCL